MERKLKHSARGKDVDSVELKSKSRNEGIQDCKQSRSRSDFNDRYQAYLEAKRLKKEQETAKKSNNFRITAVKHKVWSPVVNAKKLPARTTRSAAPVVPLGQADNKPSLTKPKEPFRSVKSTHLKENHGETRTNQRKQPQTTKGQPKGAVKPAQALPAKGKKTRLEQLKTWQEDRRRQKESRGTKPARKRPAPTKTAPESISQPLVRSSRLSNKNKENKLAPINVKNSSHNVTKERGFAFVPDNFDFTFPAGPISAISTTMTEPAPYNFSPIAVPHDKVYTFRGRTSTPIPSASRQRSNISSGTAAPSHITSSSCTTSTPMVINQNTAHAPSTKTPRPNTPRTQTTTPRTITPRTRIHAVRRSDGVSSPRGILRTADRKKDPVQDASMVMFKFSTPEYLTNKATDEKRKQTPSGSQNVPPCTRASKGRPNMKVGGVKRKALSPSNGDGYKLSMRKLNRSSLALRGLSPKEGVEVLMCSPMVELDRRSRKKRRLNEFLPHLSFDERDLPANESLFINDSISEDCDDESSENAANTSKSSPSERTVIYYRVLVLSETQRLNIIADEWEKYGDENEAALTSEICGDIRTVVGQARLLIAQRFKQFLGLVDDCEYKRGEKETTCTDLQGFWEMIYYQVEDVNKKIENLETLREKNWQHQEEPKKNVAKRTVVKKKASTKPVTSGPSKFAAFRKQLKQQKQQEQSPTVTIAEPPTRRPTRSPARPPTVEPTKGVKSFEGGFFSLHSPLKSTPPGGAGAIRRSASPAVTQSPHSLARKPTNSPRNRLSTTRAGMMRTPRSSPGASNSPLLLVAALNRSMRRSSCVTPVNSPPQAASPLKHDASITVTPGVDKQESNKGRRSLRRSRRLSMRDEATSLAGPSAKQSEQPSEDVELDVSYYRTLLNTETLRLDGLAELWERIGDENQSSMSADVCGDIRTVVGQARLLIAQRFKQFLGLVDDCEYKRGEKETTCTDLQGFWEMIYYQVEDVNNKISALEKLRDNNWQKEQPKMAPKKRVVKKRAASKAATKTGPSKFAVFRQQMKQQQKHQELPPAVPMVVEPSSATNTTTTTLPDNTASPTTAPEMKDFHGGFFSVSSPVLTAPHTEPSPLRSPALRRSMRRSVQHSPAVQGRDAGRDSRSPLLLMAALNRSCRKSSHLSPACGDSMEQTVLKRTSQSERKDNMKRRRSLRRSLRLSHHSSSSTDSDRAGGTSEPVLDSRFLAPSFSAPGSPMQVEPPLEYRAPVEPLEINDVDMAAKSKKCLAESFNSTTDGGKGKRNGRHVSAPQRKSLERTVVTPSNLRPARRLSQSETRRSIRRSVRFAAQTINSEGPSVSPVVGGESETEQDGVARLPPTPYRTSSRNRISLSDKSPATLMSELSVTENVRRRAPSLLYTPRERRRSTQIPETLQESGDLMVFSPEDGPLNIKPATPRMATPRMATPRPRMATPTSAPHSTSMPRRSLRLSLL